MLFFVVFDSVEHCIFCFFFSSRRRHTRFDCDWSSDVCSSDLVRPHTADLQERKSQTAAEWKNTPGMRHGQRRREIRKGWRTADSPEKGTRGATIAAQLRHLAKAESQATRTRARFRRTLLARPYARFQTVRRAQITWVRARQ